MDLLPWVIIGTASLINSLLGFYIYFKNSKSVTNVTFFFFTLTLSLYLILNQLSLMPSKPETILFWMRSVMVLAGFLNISFFLVASAFPSEKLSLSRKLKIGILVSTSLLALISFTPLLFSGVDISQYKPIPGPGMVLFLLHTLTYLGGGLIILIKKYRRSEGKAKAQIRFVLLGVVVMFSLIIFSNVILVFAFNFSSLVSLLPLYITLFVASVAYSIVKHQFLDLSYLVFRTISFTLLTLAVVAIYALLLFNLLNVIDVTYHTIVSIALAVLLVYTYNPLKRAIEKLTKNLFFKQPYVTDQLLESLGTILRSTIALRHLTKNTLSTLTSTMHVSQACFVINQQDREPLLVFTGFNQKPYYSDSTIHDLAAAAKDKVLIFEELEESAVKTLMRDNKISVVLPLKVKHTNHGLLLLGEKSSGEVYSRQDIDVLEIFAPQISLAVQNAKSFEEISRFNVTLREEVARATSDFRKANRHLKHLDKLKDEFVFIATHELKNPVTAMRGYLSLLQEGTFGKIPQQMQDPIDQLQASNQQLVDLVNDLLQIARAEAKTVTIKVQPVNICDIVGQVLESVKPLADQKKINMTHVCPNVNLKVLADPQRFKEIINNLVSNAIKYSAKGTITITHTPQGTDLITHVADQGFGIAQKDHHKIFTRFFRVEEEAAKGIPGTGLGLFIVKQLVERMGGKISFDSELGKGTTFHFSLPKA